jgi:hypothetical protein
VSLTRDVVRDLGRAAADRQGIFSIEDVSTGRYLLRVERIGYQGQLLPLDVSAPPEVVEIHLEPDSALLAGLAELERQLGFRRRAATSVAQSFGEDRLRLSTMSGMRRFLENDAMLSLMPCDGREVRNDCRVLRGRVVPPRVYIDELLAQGLDHLDSYQPYELYSVDVFVCGPGDRLGGWEIHVYTYEYVDRQMKRRRQFFPSCFAL